MLYRTDDPAKWGVGKGANLAAAEIDGNFWELAERLVAVEASAGQAANGIDSITVVGSQMTVFLEDGTSRGPYTLPTAMIRYRGDWVAAAQYNELDLVTVPDVGVYLCLIDHNAAAAFDANAVDASGDPLYRFLFPLRGDTLDALGDVDTTTSPPAGGDALVWTGALWEPGTPAMALGDLADVFPANPPADGNVLMWVTADGAWRSRPAGAAGASISDEGAVVLAAPADVNFAGAGVSVADDADGTVTVTIPGGGAGVLDDLGDVTIATPAAAQFLRFDGAVWVNAMVDWSDLAGVPATFPPSAHTHDWSGVTGRPATVDALPATVGAAGAVLKAGAGGTITWGTDETTGSGGGGVGVSDEGVQLIAAATDINFVGAGVTATDDGDGTVTVTVPDPAHALDDLTDVTITTPASGQFLGHDGAGWVNAAVDWSDLANVPATFPPAAHTHTAAEISDFGEALDDRVAALLVAGTNVTLTYDDAANALTIDAAGSGATTLDGLADVDTGTAPPTDGQALVWDTASALWVPGAGGGGIADAPSNGTLYGRQDGQWSVVPVYVPDDAWTHWRLRLISEDQQGRTECWLGEIEFREVAGVAQTASGGSPFGDFAADVSGLFDGNLDGGAKAVQPFTGKAAGYQFATAKRIRQVAVYDAKNLASYAPNRFVIEASKDGTTWVEVARADPVDPPWSGFGNVHRDLAVSVPQDPVDWSRITGYPAGIDAAVEDVAGTTYAQVTADAGKWKRTTDATGVTVTIAANVNAAADEITFLQGGAGAITFAAGAGMTLGARAGALASAGQHAVCRVKFLSASEAVLFGDIA